MPGSICSNCEFIIITFGFFGSPTWESMAFSLVSVGTLRRCITNDEGVGIYLIFFQINEQWEFVKRFGWDNSRTHPRSSFEETIEDNGNGLLNNHETP